MTQIVTVLYYEHHFQYVERRYSGFVALSFVVGPDTGRNAIEVKGLQRHKKSRLPDSGDFYARHSSRKLRQIDKIIAAWKPSIPML